MLQRTYDFIKKQSMVSTSDTVLVALSGGADSVALLYILSKLSQKLGIKLYAVHINHGLRDDAAVDAKSAEELCLNLGVELEIGLCDVPRIMESQGLSLEVAARNARWDYIKAYSNKCGATKIAVAHHLGDRAETMLLNLSRGSGLMGLCAMKPMDGKIIRPLLFAQKFEIVDFLIGNGINWREDESNKDNSIPRNYIRNIVLPELSNINPSVIKSMGRAASLLNEDEDYIKSVVLGFKPFIKRDDDGYYIKRDKLSNLHVSILSRTLRLMARNNGVYRNVYSVNIDDAKELILSGQAGSSIDWTDGLKIYVESENVWMGRVPSKNMDEIALNIKGTTVFGDWEFKCMRIDVLPHDFKTHTPQVQYMDGDLLTGCVIRTRRDGDRITPFGMKGHKLLSDVLIDKKVPRRKKDGVILFAVGNLVHYVKEIGISDESAVNILTKNIIKVEFTHESS